MHVVPPKVRLSRDARCATVRHVCYDDFNTCRGKNRNRDEENTVQFQLFNTCSRITYTDKRVRYSLKSLSHAGGGGAVHATLIIHCWL